MYSVETCSEKFSKIQRKTAAKKTNIKLVSLHLLPNATESCFPADKTISRIYYRVNNKRSFIDNPYLFLATRFVYNYTHYQAISVTNFS